MTAREALIAAAQHRANRMLQTYEVQEHVGNYGRRSGDIEARHEYRVALVASLNDDAVADGWVTIAIVQPDTVECGTCARFINPALTRCPKCGSDPRVIHGS
jgi:hypothetical protein